MLDKLAPQVPLGRVGLPEEVAEAVLWLSSPSSSYVHGALLDILGGR
jgi:NAD(P)-dependent dehydrogenase (short-subunit alcohol dehydrogenase family)